jgi:hypothetical protein
MITEKIPKLPGWSQKKWKYPLAAIIVIALVFLAGDFSKIFDHASLMTAPTPAAAKSLLFKKVLVFKRPLTKSQGSSIKTSALAYNYTPPAISTKLPQLSSSMVQPSIRLPQSSIRIPQFPSSPDLYQYQSVMNTYQSITSDYQFRSSLDLNQYQSMMNNLSNQSQSVLNYYQSITSSNFQSPMYFQSPRIPYSNLNYIPPIPSIQMPSFQPMPYIPPIHFAPMVAPPSFNNFP